MKGFATMVAGVVLLASTAANAGDGCLVDHATDKIRNETLAALATSARVQLAALRSELATQVAVGGATAASTTIKAGS